MIIGLVVSMFTKKNIGKTLLILGAVILVIFLIVQQVRIGSLGTKLATKTEKLNVANLALKNAKKALDDSKKASKNIEKAKIIYKTRVEKSVTEYRGLKDSEISDQVLPFDMQVFLNRKKKELLEYQREKRLGVGDAKNID